MIEESSLIKIPEGATHFSLKPQTPVITFETVLPEPPPERVPEIEWGWWGWPLGRNMNDHAQVDEHLAACAATGAKMSRPWNVWLTRGRK